jgi:hypothetical protein
MDRTIIYKNERNDSVSTFSRERYNEYDEPGRAAATDFLLALGYSKVEPNDGKDTGNIDFEKTDLRAITEDGRIHFYEPEVKDGREHLLAWNAMLKYGTVHILARKKKNKNPLAFIVVKPGGCELVVVRGKDFAEGRTFPKKVKGRIESFVEIFNNRCARYKKENGTWKRIDKGAFAGEL